MGTSLEQILLAARKTEYDLIRGEPVSQPWFAWDAREGWRSLEVCPENISIPPVDIVSMISWNIDQFRAFEDERMKSALIYLEVYLSNLAPKPIIMLNEMLVSDLEIIQSQPWIQKGYYVTDVSHTYWESRRYGTCVLIPKSMSIAKVFRVHYKRTRQQRDALLIDIRVTNEQTLRICSTHLESLIANPPRRPSQLATAAKWMCEADASVLGGDLNAIQDFDKTLHVDNDLKDAYLETGGKQDDEAGMTWGQMAATQERKRFGLTRMDKFFFRGHIEVEHFETFGLDAVVQDEEIAKLMVQDGELEKAWVTDHLGIRADFRVNLPRTTMAPNL